MMPRSRDGAFPPFRLPFKRRLTSPIWYSPTEAARKSAAHGPTIADLKSRGAMALMTPQ
jgi:hypothetical protein